MINDPSFQQMLFLRFFGVREKKTTLWFSNKSTKHCNELWTSGQSMYHPRGPNTIGKYFIFESYGLFHLIKKLSYLSLAFFVNEAMKLRIVIWYSDISCVVVLIFFSWKVLEYSFPLSVLFISLLPLLIPEVAPNATWQAKTFFGRYFFSFLILILYSTINPIALHYWLCLLHVSNATMFLIFFLR